MADRKTSTKTARASRRATSEPAATEPVLLWGGNPQIAKGDGDAPVLAYIRVMPGDPLF